MPGGRVLSTGGDNHSNAGLYSPPYLLKGARPTISSAPSRVSYEQTFTVGAPEAGSIARVTWLHPGSVTHANPMEQRFLRLSSTVGSNSLAVTAPSDPRIWPPGYSMLLLLASNGVPSVAKIIRIG